MMSFSLLTVNNHRSPAILRKLAFLLCPEYSSLGLTAACEVLFVANWVAQQPLYEWQILSADGAAVRASNGIATPVDGGLDLGQNCQSVFVLASFEPAQAVRDRRAIGWLKRLAQFGVELGGIENGSMLLAEAGLLRGQRVAVHWDNLAGFRERYPQTQPVAELYARSGRLISCAGGTAVIDLMLAWMGWHGQAEVAEEVAEHLLIDRVRSPATAQRSPADAAAATPDDVIARTQALMAQYMEEPLSCTELSARVGLSLRQLERRYHRELGASVLHHYRMIRIARAHQLLQQTPLPVTEVALSCGFRSPEYFCRLYRSMLGVSPSADRQQSTTAPVLRRRPAPRGSPRK